MQCKALRETPNRLPLREPALPIHYVDDVDRFCQRKPEMMPFGGGQYALRGQGAYEAAGTDDGRRAERKV